SAVNALSNKHEEHIAVYGAGLAERLTGLHETCAIDEFRQGVGDRGASIRIPAPVAAQGFGYLEDRRPAANADPYEVSARILQTVCNRKESKKVAAASTQQPGALSIWQKPADTMSSIYLGE